MGSKIIEIFNKIAYKRSTNFLWLMLRQIIFIFQKDFDKKLAGATNLDTC